MITAKEANNIAAKWVTYQLRQIEPLIRQAAAKGKHKLYLDQYYHNSRVQELVDALNKQGFKIEVISYNNNNSKIILEW